MLNGTLVNEAAQLVSGAVGLERTMPRRSAYMPLPGIIRHPDRNSAPCPEPGTVTARSNSAEYRLHRFPIAGQLFPSKLPFNTRVGIWLTVT